MHSESDFRPRLRATFRLLRLVAAAGLSLGWAVAAAPSPMVLFDFAAAYPTNQMEVQDAGLSLAAGGGLGVRTGHAAPWPGVTLKAPGGTWALDPFARVAVELRNPGTNAVTINCRVDNAGADGTRHCVNGSTTVTPGGRSTLTVPLKRSHDDRLGGVLFGMRGYPVAPGGDGTVDPAQITQVLLFLNQPGSEHAFVIEQVRAEGTHVRPTAWVTDADPFIPFIDGLGQYAHKGWPGKTESVSALAERRAAEQRELAADPGPAGWDKYGGWAAGPLLKATGFFRTEKYEGRWWLVDPDGRLFFSQGIDCVRMLDVTPISEREDWYIDPPWASGLEEFLVPEAFALHGHYSGRRPRCFGFAAANLRRKYGGDWRAESAAVAHPRLKHWGLNTIGMWSDEATRMLRRTPYVDATGSGGARLIEGSEGYWGKFPDVFDESFPRALRRGMEGKRGKSAGDPWCLGYFADNEMSWGDDVSLAEAALKSPADQPVKRVFMDDLRQAYGTIEALNQAWGTTHASWEALREYRGAPDRTKAGADLGRFYTKIADTYFRSVRDAIREVAPHQLYLGCRFAWANARAAASAARFCDVVSYNLYQRSVADYVFNGGADVPLIIGEFHFGALDRGMFHTGLVPVADQAERADAYTKYVLGALRHPQFVGCHWFQYQDEPTTGRVYDEENYQIGFVDTADTPYAETIAASRAVAEQMYQVRSGASHPLDASNVIWDSPSTNAYGSMPAGNGDVGLNVWMETNGDLRFHLGKTDAWDEHGRLVKVGSVRVRLEPNPFQPGRPFRQELRLREGAVVIEGGSGADRTTLRVWVDAHQPRIWVEAEGPTPTRLEARLELWRTAERVLTGEEAHGVDGFGPGEPPRVSPDTVLPGPASAVAWYHRNERSIWPATLRHQGIEAALLKVGGDTAGDPILWRTYGGWMEGEGCVKRDPVTLASEQPRREHRLAIQVLTAQRSAADAWVEQLEQEATRGRQTPVDAAWREHTAWWGQFWDRSWVRVTSTDAPPGPGGRPAATILTQAYALQRFVSACAGRGAFPIKFNGSIFNVEVPGKFDADYRRWGGCYWFQNTRLPYWPMLASGDFDCMLPLFRMYREALPLALARTPVYFGHEGAFFPETMYFWGAYGNGEFGYGWKREGLPVGITENRYIRHYYSGALELTALMLEYEAFTGDQAFLNSTLLPVAEAVVRFYDRHYPRGADGRIRFEPSQSLETWWECVDPMPEVAGLRVVLDGLLALPAGTVAASQGKAWEALRAQLPEIPLREIDGQSVLAPARTFAVLSNSENPELYAVFPYRVYGVGKPDLELARRAFAHRQFKGNSGWQQDDTQAALLGLTQEAGERLLQRVRSWHPESRFPAFWGPNFDWVPDQDHGGNALMALQTMVLQWDGERIFVFPAWPKGWDVEFKLHAPGRTVVEGAWRNGKPVEVKTIPQRREADVVLPTGA